METLESRLQKRMHVSLYALLFLTVLLGLSVLLEGCTDSCEVKSEYAYYEPVYTTLEELRTSIALLEPQPIHTVGKIYYKAHYLFINQPGEGVHIIDNTNPSLPVVKSFLKIPGNYELAIKGNTLYADSFIDLVSFDISDFNNIKEVNRLENVFSNYNSLGFYVSERGIVTDWALKEEVKIYQSDCEANLQTWGGMYCGDGIAVNSNGEAFNKSAAIAPGNGSSPGVGGSMARFTINKDHLYILDAGNLQSFDVTNESNPIAKEKTYLNWDIETIFPYGDNLFIGSSSGMHIFNVANPSSPTKVSTYEHVRSCDPVVVGDRYAYVTLRSGTQCQGFSNQLEVIDIQNLQEPKLLKTYAMHNPHGLGIDNSTLFVCDGDQGLKVYNAKDINTIDQNQLAHYSNIHAYDVIPFENTLIMIGEDGIFQYDYSNPKAIKFLSEIAIVHEN